MPLSAGQAIAVRQLERIANVEGSALRIDNIEAKDDIKALLAVDVSLSCSHYAKAPGGLSLHNRESVRIWIPADFPFHAPAVTTAHTRFLGFDHVQWGNTLCLYQSKDVQWLPSRGMFGFIEQLDSWFAKAAINQLDHPEGPLHPPVAYPISETTVCVLANAPRVTNSPWFGAAILRARKRGLLDLILWQEIFELNSETRFAPAVLLNFELPFEYPRTVRALLGIMEKRGVATSLVLAHLMLASRRLGEGEPLHVVIGTPSRGVAGDFASRLQHLKVWEIASEDILILQNAALACDIWNAYSGRETPEETKALIHGVWDRLLKWQNEAKVGWCSTMEDRPEIVLRRDEGSPMEWFKGKSVAIWGCGALGGAIAEFIVRAGAKRVDLYDDKKVHPGILPRQNFVEQDVNDSKTHALRRRLLAINGDANIGLHAADVLEGMTENGPWDRAFDVVIDATASLSVRSKLEVLIRDTPLGVPIAAMMVSGAARHGMMTLAPIGYSGGTLDVMRRLGLSVSNRPHLTDWAKAFWGSESDERTRQPEPGCSDPTFVGSHADVAGLAARMLNRLAVEIKKGDIQGLGCLFKQDAAEARDIAFRYSPDIVVNGGNLQFRLEISAWRDTQGWIRRGARMRSAQHETGGLLFGELDETLGIGWITNVSGPPADSSFSEDHFICGIQGTQELCAQHEERSNGVVRYVGTWHSHPRSAPSPSNTDYAGVASIFASNPVQGAHQLMMIIGNAAQPNQQIGMYAFEKEHLNHEGGNIALTLNARGGIRQAPLRAGLGKVIGLALSGGGSRAVAFHLGTLRALHDLDLLDDVKVVSGVSGGSLLTGIYGYTNCEFDQVEQLTRRLLSRGLVRSSLWKLVHPYRVLKLVASVLIVGIPSILVAVSSGVLSRVASSLVGKEIMARCKNWLQWPLPRWYSRTHVFADAIQDVVGPKNCDAATRDGKSIVFNACELRTGTAFRMSNKSYGSWRVGYAPAGDLRVAEAIAASAAYPPMLPPFDWTRPFIKGGEQRKTRVIITDGGVFENIGVSVMEPGRELEHSGISYSADVIIASDAGAGQFVGDGIPSIWSARMIQVLNSVMRKVQDATKARLHNYAAKGDIEAFLYIHLGQIDSKVAMKPSDWIRREEVLTYPTDFSAMPEHVIDALSMRGETITRTLVMQYLLSN